jgi:hypothetical protein
MKFQFQPQSNFCTYLYDCVGLCVWENFENGTFETSFPSINFMLLNLIVEWLTNLSWQGKV